MFDLLQIFLNFVRIFIFGLFILNNMHNFMASNVFFHLAQTLHEPVIQTDGSKRPALCFTRTVKSKPYKYLQHKIS